MIADELTDSIEDQISDADEETFTLSGGDALACLPINYERAVEVVVGGKINVISAGFYVLKSLFSVVHPVVGRRVEFRGRTHRIVTVGDDASGTYYKILMEDAN